VSGGTAGGGVVMSESPSGWGGRPSMAKLGDGEGGGGGGGVVSLCEGVRTSLWNGRSLLPVH
jgi:hypothetical protein